MENNTKTLKLSQNRAKKLCYLKVCALEKSNSKYSFMLYRGVSVTKSLLQKYTDLLLVLIVKGSALQYCIPVKVITCTNSQ